MSADAAGWARCGADLDPRRWQNPLSLSRVRVDLPVRRRRVLSGPRAELPNAAR